MGEIGEKCETESAILFQRGELCASDDAIVQHCLERRVPGNITASGEGAPLLPSAYLDGRSNFWGASAYASRKSSLKMALIVSKH